MRSPIAAPPAPRAAVGARKVVGSFLRSVRESQRLTQEQVAALTSCRPWQLSRAAISSIERGRNLPSMEALVALSHVLHVDPMEVLERAELATTPSAEVVAGESLDELSRQAFEQFWSGDFRRALATLDAMREQVALDPPADEEERARLRAEIELRRSVTLRRCGALLAARAAAERTIVLAADHTPLRAQAYALLTEVLLQMGKEPLAADTMEKAVELARNCEPRVEARSWFVKGRVLLTGRRWEEARVAFLEARDRMKKAGDTLNASHVEGNIGICWLGMGRKREARIWVTRAAELARKLEQPTLEASWLVELGGMDLDDGRLDDADRKALAALQIVRPLEHWFMVFRAEWLRHRIVRRRKPEAPDRHRLAFLTRLLTRLDEYRGEEDLKEFERTIRMAGARPEEIGS